MPEIAAKTSQSPALLIRVSVPANGRLRGVVIELARKVAEYLGARPNLDAMGDSLDRLASKVSEGPNPGDITFEFREVDRELVVQARCNNHASEIRYPLGA